MLDSSAIDASVLTESVVVVVAVDSRCSCTGISLNYLFMSGLPSNVSEPPVKAAA